MKNFAYIRFLFIISFVLISIPAIADNLLTAAWIPIDKLSSQVSGPGVVVTEPISDDKKLGDFGAGCARWLHLNVSSNIAFGKTPGWDALEKVAVTSDKKNLQFTQQEAKVLFKRLGITHVVTSTIQKDNDLVSLKWQVWKLPNLTLVSSISSGPSSQESIIKQLSETGEKLVSIMGGDTTYYKKNVSSPSLNAADISFVGSLPWGLRYELDTEALARLDKLSRQSLLASMFYVSHFANTKTFDRFREQRQSIALAFLKKHTMKGKEAQDIHVEDTRNLLASEYYALGYRHLKGMKNIAWLNPSLSELKSNSLAQMEQFLGNEEFEDNLQHAELAVRLNINNPAAWSDLAYAYELIAQQKRHSRAASAISEDEWEYLKKAYDYGLNAAQKSVQLDATNGYYWLQLARAATFANDYDIANDAMNNVLRLIPNEPQAYYWGMEMYLPRWFDKSIKFGSVMDQVIQHPDCLADIFGYISKYVIPSIGGNDVKKELYTDAFIPVLSHYAENHPYNAMVQFDLVSAYRYLGQKEKAQAAAEQIIKILPDDPTGYQALLPILVDEGDKKAAIKAANEVIILTEEANRRIK